MRAGISFDLSSDYLSLEKSRVNSRPHFFDCTLQMTNVLKLFRHWNIDIHFPDDNLSQGLDEI